MLRFSWWFSLTVCSVLAMQSASAKEAFPTALPTVPIEQTTPKALTKEQRSLLIKAFKTYFGSDHAQSSTTSKIEVKSGVLSFQAVVNHKTLIESAKRYRSEIEYISNDGVSSRKYLVVSDNKILWVYRPDAKKFAILPQKPFGKDPFALLNVDALSTVFLMRPPNVQQLLKEDIKDSAEIVKTLTQLGLEVAGNEIDAQGNTLVVYKTSGANLPQAKAYNFEARLLIDPNTETLKQIDFSGEQKGVRVKMSEIILERSTPTTFDPKTFSFYPPIGTKRVPKLSVVPWGE
jgi:outer membrane lipoprotein-sorting protein